MAEENTTSQNSEEQVKEDVVAQPAPVETATPPVAEQPAPQPTVPPTQQVQYITTQKSLNGIGGWLIGWLIYLALIAISSITMFFALIQVKTSGSTSSNMFEVDASANVSLIFMPLLAIASIGAIIFVSQRKLLGKMLSIATIGVYLLWLIIMVMIGGGELLMIVSSVCVMALLSGLQALYFFQSERVKQTLTK